MHVSIWLIRRRVGSPFTGLSVSARLAARDHVCRVACVRHYRSQDLHRGPRSFPKEQSARNLDRGYPLMPSRPSASWTPSTLRNGIRP